MSGLTQSIYHAAPIWVQQRVVAGYGWWWYKRRFGSDFHRLAGEFRSREQWTAEQFSAYQQEQLNKLLAAAWHSPYYRSAFIGCGLGSETLPLADLASIPMLAKETIRTKGHDLLTRETRGSRTVVFESSGTTGTPTQIYYTPEFHALELAVAEARNLNWAGVTYQNRRIMFGVRKVCSFDQQKPPFWRLSPAENMAYASIYHLSDKFLPHYLEFLRAYKPETIMGYPSALHTIARYAAAHNDRPAPAKGVFTTSETVSTEAREMIEKAWQCRIHDRYGAVEGCLFASQCEYGQYHVSPEIGIIEILNRFGKPVKPREMGEVVCTGLQNLLQPLIRYRIGDVARWAADQHCRCGRQMPILESIDGRVEDVCYTADGREVVRFDTVFKGVGCVREAQVVQEQLNVFTIYVVPDFGFSSSHIQAIKDNLRLHVGVVHGEVKTVDAIARTASGKFRAVVCKLAPSQVTSA